MFILKILQFHTNLSMHVPPAAEQRSSWKGKVVQQTLSEPPGHKPKHHFYFLQKNFDLSIYIYICTSNQAIIFAFGRIATISTFSLTLVRLLTGTGLRRCSNFWLNTIVVLFTVHCCSSCSCRVRYGYFCCFFNWSSWCSRCCWVRWRTIALLGKLKHRSQIGSLNCLNCYMKVNVNVSRDPTKWKKKLIFLKDLSSRICPKVDSDYLRGTCENVE